MSARSELNALNRVFLVCGIGSINYNQCNNYKITLLFYILRYVIVCLSLIAMFDTIRKAINYDQEMSELTSIIMICCFHLTVIGRLISHAWRLFFDNRLSMVLTKLEAIQEKLIKLKVVSPMNIKKNWFIIIGIIVYFIAYNIPLMYWMITDFRYTYNFRYLAGWLVSNVCLCSAYCEYTLLIFYIKWIVNKINEEIPERRSCISTFRDMYLEVLECLYDVNRSIYGLPVIIGLIGTNICHIINLLYRYILFPRAIINSQYFVYFAIITILLKFFNIILLYGLGHVTEIEINRMSMVLHKRSLIERNPRLKRQIKFFLLRRLHEHHNFELYGICKINLRQLFFLLNKAIAYLLIQILFKLNKKSI